MLDVINKIIEKDVRPYLLNHNGDIEAISYESGILRVRLLGQCQNCPAAQTTFEDIVSIRLKESVPEIKQVILHNDVSDDLYDFAKKILNKEKQI